MKYEVAGRVALILTAATLCLIVAACSNEPSTRPGPAARARPEVEMSEGGIVRGPRSSQEIALVFTGHEFAEGAETILDELKKHHAKGSFFLTGDFLANTNFAPAVKRIMREGHYLGPHSDKHLLYCPWTGPKTALVTREQFRADLDENLRKLEVYGVRRGGVRYFLPPYEHYNQEIANWAREMGLTLVNYTPGTRSNADYTGEADGNFVPSQKIFDSIAAKAREPGGLDGYLLLLHIGAGPGRSDKFHPRFGELLEELRRGGYRFSRVDEMVEGFTILTAD